MLEYANAKDKEWPYSSNIIDFVRCSVTFDNVKDYINGFNYLYKKFNSINNKGLGGDLNHSSNNNTKNNKSCIQGIVRIKNDFNSISSQNISGDVSTLKLDKFQYMDIKCNVLIEHNNVKLNIFEHIVD